MGGEPPVPREKLEEFLRTSSEPFGSFTGSNGEAYLLERSMVEWFLNDLPQPSQQSLDEVTRGATRVRFIEGGCLVQALGKKVVLEFSQPDKIRQFADLLRLLPDEGRWHCMCRGDYAVELLQSDGSLQYLGFHHGKSLRRDEVWGGDANLASPQELVEWLAAQGLTKPLESLRNDQRQALAAQKKSQAWLEAGPECLRDSVSRWLQNGQNKQDLATVYEISAEQPLAELVPKLLEWCAFAIERSGPIQDYQPLPAWILDTIQQPGLISALGGELNKKQQTGLAALLFQPLRLPLLLELPTPTRLKLLARFPKEGTYQFGDQLPRDYQLLMQSAPPPLIALLPEVWSAPRADYSQRFFGDSPSKAEPIRQLLSWAARIPPRSLHSFRTLLNLVDSLISSIPLDQVKPILLDCIQSPPLTSAVARHLAEASGYRSGAFADFPESVKRKLMHLAESSSPQNLPHLARRLDFTQKYKALFGVVKVVLALAVLYWLYRAH